MARQATRNLIIVLGDQLDADSAAFEGFDTKLDAVWMAEAVEESTHVWTSKPRIALFLAAMRHFRDELQERGWTIEYDPLTTNSGRESLESALRDRLRSAKPERLRVVLPGEWRVKEMLEKVAEEANVPLDILEDTHFYCTPDDFKEHADGRKSLRMEYFYREMRKKNDILMEGKKPTGGDWNYDADNRETFGKEGPQNIPRQPTFKPDKTTREVINLVNERFAAHPGSLEAFNWPVTRKQALEALDDFIDNRLPCFGPYQDAMWTGQPFLNHSLLSSCLNLKLLNPREVVSAAERAFRRKAIELNSVEGFIRQILGWREYVRGVYWLYMPNYIERNHLGAEEPLPAFFWTGETEFSCLRESIGQTLHYGYAHHIQRLMVTGLYCLLLGVEPKKVHEWYLAVYVDAVEWVELPNTLGMSQYGDSGIMASKPYVATGKYIQRMSNYCGHCPRNPAKATGDDACPFTTLYWDFLQRHRIELEGNRRMSLQVRNLDRKSEDELKELRDLAHELRKEPAGRADAQTKFSI